MATTRRWALDFTVAAPSKGAPPTGREAGEPDRVDAFAGPCRLGGPGALGASLGLATPEADLRGLIGAALSHTFRAATDLTGKADPSDA